MSALLHGGEFGSLAQASLGPSKEGSFAVSGMVTLSSSSVIHMICQSNLSAPSSDTEVAAWTLGGAYVSAVTVGDLTDQ